MPMSKFWDTVKETRYFPSLNKSHLKVGSGFSNWTASTPYQISAEKLVHNIMSNF